MKQLQNDEEMFFKHWETKALSLKSKKFSIRNQPRLLISESLDFDERYTKLKTKLESELTKRIVKLKFDRLPEDISEEAIIDMADSIISEDVFFTSHELFILRRYNNQT